MALGVEDQAIASFARVGHLLDFLHDFSIWFVFLGRNIKISSIQLIPFCPMGTKRRQASWSLAQTPQPSGGTAGRLCRTKPHRRESFVELCEEEYVQKAQIRRRNGVSEQGDVRTAREQGDLGDPLDRAKKESTFFVIGRFLGESVSSCVAAHKWP